jgi:hypothetical protein
MALQALLHERPSCRLVPFLRYEGLQDLALLIDRTPELNHLAVQLHVHLIKIPLPVPEAKQVAHAPPADLGREHRAEPVPSWPHCLVAEIIAALKKQVLDVAQ